MGQTHVLKTPKEPQMWFFISDLHSRHLHLPTFNILLKHSQLLPKKQRNLIIGGDFLDLAEFMPKNPEFQHWKDRKDGIDEFFLPAYQKEIKWGNDTLDAIQSHFNHIIFMHGNHDGPRIEVFLDKYCPEGYKPNFNIDRDLNLEKRNVGSISYNSWCDFGELSITHGMFHGPSAASKHYMACGGRNVLYGHLHTSECKTFPVRNESRCAWSNPAMCGLNPDYVKNAENKWQNGYTTIYMKPSGKFNINQHLVFDDELLLPNGEVIKG